MKFGSKGLDAPTIIGIIVAVIVAIVIIYILWTRGMLPFAPAADRNTCLSELLNACSNVKKLKDVNDGCVSFSDIKDKCGGCITGSAAQCDPGGADYDTCCTWVRGVSS